MLGQDLTTELRRRREFQSDPDFPGPKLRCLLDLLKPIWHREPLFFSHALDLPKYPKPQFTNTLSLCHIVVVIATGQIGSLCYGDNELLNLFIDTQVKLQQRQYLADEMPFVCFVVFFFLYVERVA